MISFKTCFSRPHILPEIELYCPYILNKRPLVLKVVQQENSFLCIRHEELLLCNFSGHLMTRKGNAPFMLCEKLFCRIFNSARKILNIFCIYSRTNWFSKRVRRNYEKKRSITFERENVVIWSNKIDICVTHDGLRECVISSYQTRDLI